VRRSWAAACRPDAAAGCVPRSRPSASWPIQYVREQSQPGLLVGEVEPEHGSARIAEHLRVTGRLSRDEGAERELLARHRQVLRRCPRDLQVDPYVGSALVELTGRVEEARAPAERDGPPDPSLEG